jgi:hypothetical protein
MSGLGVRAGETDHREVDTALRPDTHYWATDLLEELGCKVHLAHPLGNYPDVAVMPNFG